ncbi:MAG: nuclear transport factor 2 family protein [Kaiparowitsia implicata GSE-PSE-MK54-09C]|jgi:hypothetical protein|nr:nuclear transport factor 2 family protein [Kaiparowitsia implicata GSE-PSE-MK54-09C]
MQDLIDLEEQGWQALSTDVEASKKFYSSVLRHDAVMLFPGGMIIEGKEKILQSLSAQPWKSFQIEEPRVISLSERAEVLVYRVIAQRQGSEPYVALINSTYELSDGMWKLVLHQQTPV